MTWSRLWLWLWLWLRYVLVLSTGSRNCNSAEVEARNSDMLQFVMPAGVALTRITGCLPGGVYTVQEL